MKITGLQMQKEKNIHIWFFQLYKMSKWSSNQFHGVILIHINISSHKVQDCHHTISYIYSFMYIRGKGVDEAGIYKLQLPLKCMHKYCPQVLSSSQYFIVGYLIGHLWEGQTVVPLLSQPRLWNLEWRLQKKHGIYALYMTNYFHEIWSFSPWSPKFDKDK